MVYILFSLSGDKKLVARIRLFLVHTCKTGEGYIACVYLQCELHVSGFA